MIRRCITYGCGNSFDPELFETISNVQYFPKPRGGLWSSPVRGKHCWKEAATNMEIGCFETSFKFYVNGEILVIDCFEDLDKMTWTGPSSFMRMSSYRYPNFEKISLRYQAIFLTAKGERETRLTYPRNLYGWDCATILILDKDCIYD